MAKKNVNFAVGAAVAVADKYRNNEGIRELLRQRIGCSDNDLVSGKLKVNAVNPDGSLEIERPNAAGTIKPVSSKFLQLHIEDKKEVAAPAPTTETAEAEAVAA